MKLLDDSAWFCVEKLKKHIVETNKFKICHEIQKNNLNRCSKTDSLIKSLDDSALFCMEKLKKHSFEIKKLEIQLKYNK